MEYVSDTERLRRVGVVSADHRPVALVAASAHQDLAALLDAGFRLTATPDDSGTSVIVRLEED